MSAAPVKNIAASVKNRLLAAARQSGKLFQTILRATTTLAMTAKSDFYKVIMLDA